MRCEVVAIGTELLLGVIVDTNSSWIGEQLALAGIDSYFQTKVGDNFGRMEQAIRLALERSDAVICCGGLGPTQDDITRDVIAKVMGVELVRDETIAAAIRHRFESRGRTMSLNNLRQADIPVGAHPIPEMPGTAPGLVCPIGDKVIYCVPGVPSEVHEMVLGTVIPDLRRRMGASAVIRSRTLRTWGVSESGIDEMLTERMAELDRLRNPTIAFNASGIEGIKVRVTAKCDDEETAVRILDAEEKILRAILGEAVFGIDDESMELVVLNGLKGRGMTLAAAESITGGIMSSRLSAIDMSMTTFKGSIIRPDRDSMQPPELPPEARSLREAKAARDHFGTDVGLAVVAADRDEGARPGTVYITAVFRDTPHADMTVLPGDRRRMREYGVISAMNFVRKVLGA
ncbi:MAG: CinA family nicotinamide mononucleotide deamidase-related protein [Hyphomicrobiaceae bacterium]|nr:CinA family nicotinamide mononucleotide deamidase-related protein [Hyphomicrobiaceae bacterium]